MTEKPPLKDPTLEETPPVFRSWGFWYALVLLTLATLIFVFYQFTRAFDSFSMPR